MLRSAPQGATINSQTGIITWSPTAAGSYSFSVIASDRKGASTVQAFTLTVKSPVVNSAPVASNATYVVQKDGSIKIDLRSLARDADGDTLAMTLTNPSKGTLTKNADGTYTYKPKKGYTGNDSFSYTVSDGKLTATGTISLNARASRQDDEQDDDCQNNRSNSHQNRSASVTVTSRASSSPSRDSDDEQEIHYVVINSAAQTRKVSTPPLPDPATTPTVANGSSAPAINWGGSGAAASLAGGSPPPSQGNSWLSQLLADNQASAPVDLGQTTGLKVKL